MKADHDFVTFLLKFYNIITNFLFVFILVILFFLIKFEGFYSNTNLGLMRLDRNQFTGTISDSIGNLNKLGDMRIDENLFSGKLPASLMNLSNLGKNHFSDNHLISYHII